MNNKGALRHEADRLQQHEVMRRDWRLTVRAAS